MTQLTSLDDAIEALDYAYMSGLQRADVEDPKDGRGFVWRELRKKCGVDSTYFRGGVPLVAFAEAENSDGVITLQRRLWNLSRVPILIAKTPTELAAHSCFDAPPLVAGAGPRALLRRPASNASEVLEQFKRAEVERGGVAARYRDRFRRSGRVDRRLLANLRELRRRFEGSPDELRILDSIVGRVIFIRYLEDRQILPVAQLRDATGKDTLIEVLRSGSAATYELFALLARKFNGDVFGFSATEHSEVNDMNVAAIGDFFAGTELDSGQQSLWPYDFSIIPPELISSVYEQLLEDTQRSDGAYYTPRRVVDLILDETLPWEPTSTPPRILDPSCGSGMFLTEAFRRLVFQRSTAAGTRPDFMSLERLLTESIFGVDKSPVAVGVAALGLYLALLEEVDSELIWDSAHLPPIVGQNLIVSDFFSDHPFRSQTFDIVVGNPPWGSKLSKEAEKYCSDHEVSVPDKQIALLFLHAAERFVTQEGVLGFLLPSKALLHNRSGPALDARRTMFQRLGVETVIDLAAIRRDVFPSAVAPASALIARPGSGLVDRNDSQILHVVPRLSSFQASIDGLVVSQDDIHSIPVGLAVQSEDVWKTLLWGSLADQVIITRLRQTFLTLRDIAFESSWHCGRGIQVKGGDQNDARFLKGMRCVDADAIKPLHIKMENFATVDEEFMHRPRHLGLFEGPHVLIRRGLDNGRPVAAFSDVDIVHNDSVIGISGSHADSDQLQLATAYINSSVGLYYQFMTSSSWGVERNYVELSEHLSLPVPYPSADVASSVLTALEVATEKAKAGVADWRAFLDEAVFEAYKLTEIERRRVLDSLSVRLSMFSDGADSSAYKRPAPNQLAEYSALLEETLRATLESVRVKVTVDDDDASYVIVTVQLTGLRGSPKSDESWTNDAESHRVYSRRALVSEVENEAFRWPSLTTVVKPSTIVLKGTDAFFVKPRETRYWTASQAHEDVGRLLGAVLASRDDEATTA